MIFEKEFLMQNFEENSEGLEPEEFLRERVPLLIDVWIQNENGKGLFRQVGPYWECLHPILKKYASDELTRYSAIAGPFEQFHPEILKVYDYKNDLLNFMAALAYMEKRIDSLSDPKDAHIIEVNGDEIPYIPNMNIDKNQYHGHE